MPTHTAIMQEALLDLANVARLGLCHVRPGQGTLALRLPALPRSQDRYNGMVSASKDSVKTTGRMFLCQYSLKLS